MVTGLDVKVAVDTAKRYVTELFATEGVVNLGLEEVEYDDTRHLWLITLGFSRVRDADGNALNHTFATLRRDYKVVSLDDSGRILSVKNREPADAR